MPARRDRLAFSRLIPAVVRSDPISCHWVRRFPLNEGDREGYHLRNRYFTTINWSSMRTVADRQTCCLLKQALLTSFPGVPTSMTLNAQSRHFQSLFVIFAVTHISRVNCVENTLHMKFSALSADFNSVKLF